MSEHHPHRFIGETFHEWCDLCQKQTLHRADPVQVGTETLYVSRCLSSHYKKQLTNQQQRRRQKHRQGELFT